MRILQKKLYTVKETFHYDTIPIVKMIIVNVKIDNHHPSDIKFKRLLFQLILILTKMFQR